MAAMSAAREYDLIGHAVAFALDHAERVEAEVVDALQTSAATGHVNALRVLTMHSSIIAIGAFQTFEGLLQQKNGWKDGFKGLDQHLRAGGHADLADRFFDYRDAINVLKHGDGRSYEKLLARQGSLPFTVKNRGQRFFDEGDVWEGIRLIDADHAFVRQCAVIIDEAVEALQSLPRSN